LLVIVGPCSIHDERAALEYATRLQGLCGELGERLYVIMRVYFEKPRTAVGWKGLINDPHLDGSFDIEGGIRKAREILLRITELGLPAATEMLDPIIPQYIADLVSWAAIGARTTESQTHRQMASGLSMPVGYKNGTDGSLQGALDAMSAARHAHSFLGIDDDGLTAIIDTRGNPWGHLILRGGRSGPNYDPAIIADAVAALRRAGLPAGLAVDCSHANSGRKFENQGKVWRSVLAQRAAGNRDLIGVMLESNLHEGSQALGDDPAQLRYGVSVTDECIGWEETESLLREGAALLAGV
jgi:3-deoxy-7-phosphoheptulonate synthase